MCKISGVKLLWSSYLARLTTAIPLCFSRSMAPQLLRDTFGFSQKKTASRTRPWKDVPPEPISVWTAARLHRGWVTPFFFVFFQLLQWPSDCLCSGESYTTAKGTNKNFKSHPVGTQQSQTEGRFFFYVLFFRGSVSPRRCHRHNAASEFPISLAGMWRGCLIRLSSLAQTLWEMLGTFLHFYNKMHKPYNKRRRAMMWKSQHKT